MIHLRRQTQSMNPFSLLTDHITGLTLIVMVMSSVFADLMPVSSVKSYLKNLTLVAFGFGVLIWFAASIALVWGDFLRSGR